MRRLSAVLVMSRAKQCFGGVETGGSWCVCAVGTGPDDIVAREQIATTTPLETLSRIVEFFKSAPPPAAIGIGSFGPVHLHAGSPHWGEVGRTPKPGWSHTLIAPKLERELGIPVSFDTDGAVAALGEYRWA